MDPIGDLINRIRTGYAAKRATVLVPYSKLKEEIAKFLEAKRYIVGFEKKGRKVRKFLELELRYEAGRPAFHGAHRISRPSRRLYVKAGDIRTVRQGFGTLLVSTSKGLMSGEEARKAGMGGEMIVEVW